MKLTSINDIEDRDEYLKEQLQKRGITEVQFAMMADSEAIDIVNAIRSNILPAGLRHLRVYMLSSGLRYGIVNMEKTSRFDNPASSQSIRQAGSKSRPFNHHTLTIL